MVIQRRRADAKKDRAALKADKRKRELAAFRDRLRRRKLADGEPIPDDLVEQEWERVIARTLVRGWVRCARPTTRRLRGRCLLWEGGRLRVHTPTAAPVLLSPPPPALLSDLSPVHLHLLPSV